MNQPIIGVWNWKKWIDVILVTSRQNEGRMFTAHKWGNITYPLATSIGLKRHEW
jgi:hypothetical protein